MTEIVFFCVGLVVGLLLMLILNLLKKRDNRELAAELLQQSEKDQVNRIEQVIARIKESFGSLSLDALSRNTEQFLNLANEALSKQVLLGNRQLNGKKDLINQTVEHMRDDLKQLQSVIGNFEKQREQKYGELSNQLRQTTAETQKLQQTTQQLQSALKHSGPRGQWGERMAEDILRLAGFIEGVNYLKQKTMDMTTSRPDFSFLLPQGLKVNMDVKFPFDNYLRYLESESEERERNKKEFLRDVRNRIKEVTTRDYINPDDHTIDMVIVFIPNETVFSFINQNDPKIIDDAMKLRVIVCSPTTLYAILAIIRQAIDNFNLEKTALQILTLMGSFNKQWEKFSESLGRMGKKIDEAQDEFNRLVTTRRKQLDRPLKEIENLRQKAVPSISSVAPPETDDEEGDGA